MEASSSIIITLCKYLLFILQHNINYFVGVDVITACPEAAVSNVFLLLLRSCSPVLKVSREEM